MPDSFALCTGTATAKVAILNNTVRNIGEVGVDGADGIDINLNNGDVDFLGDKGARVSSLTINGNTITNIADKGVSFGSDGDAVLGLGTASNNTINNVGGIGIALRSRQTSNANYVATGNTINKAAAIGIEYSLTRTDNNATSTAVISNNTISDSGPDAIYVRTRINGQATATVANNKITSTLTTGSTRGINVEAQENSKLQIVLDGNTISGSRAEGIRVRSGTSTGNAQLNAVVKNNDVAVNNNTAALGTAGLTVSAASNSNFCLALQNNKAGATAATGYSFSKAGTSIFRVETALLPGTNVGTFSPALPLPTATFTTVATGTCIP